MARTKAKDEEDSVQTEEGLEKIIREIIAVERQYYFEKKNVTSERQRKIKEVIERHTASEEN